MLITSSNTIESNIWNGDFISWHAIIIKACKATKKAQECSISIKRIHNWQTTHNGLRHTCRDRMKMFHILSKLLKICKNERVSTKFVFPNHIFSRTSSVVTWKLQPKKCNLWIETKDNKGGEDTSEQNVHVVQFDK